MADLNLCYMPATDMARRIRAGKLSPVDLVDNALARIGEINPQLNCFCFVYPEEARAKAKTAHEAVKAGKPLGPPAWRALCHQGSDADQGQAHDARLLCL